MIARILAIIGILFTPIALITPTPAAAQMEGSLACSTENSYTQRWNTRRWTYRAEGMEVQNVCDYRIRYYYCFSFDPNPESCASASQFQYVTLSPRERQRLGVNRSSSTEYVHNIQCRSNEPLIDWRSKFTQAKGPRCQVPLPANVDRSPYPAIGTAPDPSAKSHIARRARRSPDDGVPAPTGWHDG